MGKPSSTMIAFNLRYVYLFVFVCLNILKAYLPDLFPDADFLLPLWCMSATYYVSPLGSNTSPYDTWAKAANTTSTAVSLGQSVAPAGTGYGEGHKYYIAPGNYSDRLNMAGANNAGGTVIGTKAHGTTEEGVSAQVVLTYNGNPIAIGANQTYKHLTTISTSATGYGFYGTTGHSAVVTDLVISSSAGYGLACTGTCNVTATNLSISNTTNFPIHCTGTLTVNYGKVFGNKKPMNFGNGTFVGNNLTIAGHEIEAAQIAADADVSTSVTFNNPIVVASATTARNVYTFKNLKAGATFIVNNGNWLPNGLVVNRTTDYRTTGVTLNNSISKIPRFRTPNRRGILVIGMDDAENIAHIKVLAGKLAAYGYKGTFAINANLATINNSWADVATLANAGHEISSHTRSHSNLTSLDGIDITYAPGASGASAATVTIADGTLTATVTGADHGFTRDLSTIGKISDLIVWINTNHGTKSDGATWTAAKHGTWDATAASNLADVSAQNCFNSAYHMQLDQTRYFDYEIAGSKTYIESQVIAAGGPASFECNTLVHPGDYTSADVRTAIRAAGYTGARGDYNGDWNMTTGVRAYYVGDDLVPSTITHSNVESNTASLLELLNWTGGIRFIYAHDFATVTESDWDIILATIKQSNITVMTLSEAISWMTANGTASGADGELKYTVSQTEAADYRLRPGSPAINAGVDVGLTTDYLGKPIRGVPDIGAYEFYGATGGMLMGLGVGF